MSFCGNCGKQLAPGTRFCTICGSPVQNQGDSQYIPQNPGYPQQYVSQGSGYPQQYMSPNMGYPQQYPPQNPSYTQSYSQGDSKVDSPTSAPNIFRGMMSAAKSNINRAINQTQTQAQTNKQNVQQPRIIINRPSEKLITNCPNCGAIVNSMYACCQSCGTELYNKSGASACQELCDRLDQIEACRPKETLFSAAAGLLNKAMNQEKIAPTDQQKIELISNFVVPNTKADIMEFLILAETRVETCKKMEKTSDEYVAMVQRELGKVWLVKHDQILDKAKLVLGNDPDFFRLFNGYTMKCRREKGVCQYCGGSFKMFKAVCSICGKRKDY